MGLWLLIAANLGFSQGVRSLEVGTTELSAKECGRCHEDEYAEWQQSRHRISLTNPIFVAGFAAEPVARCIRCHAPLEPQLEAVKAARRKHEGLPTTGLAAEGVNCVVCHIRNGEVMRPWDDRSGDSSLLCAGCHQFNFHEMKRGQLILTDTPIQNTHVEWQNYIAHGGVEGCIDCHMTGGNHQIRGAHDIELLRASLKVVCTPQGLQLTPSGVGHHFPTGDVFRHLLVEGSDGHAWTELDWIGRKYASKANASGTYAMQLVLDTALRPFQTRFIPVPAPITRVRIRYCYDRNEAVCRTVQDFMRPTNHVHRVEAQAEGQVGAKEKAERIAKAAAGTQANAGLAKAKADKNRSSSPPRRGPDDLDETIHGVGR